jgi:two-component system nitrogen regulation sensor histidine kinase GlnL
MPVPSGWRRDAATMSKAANRVGLPRALALISRQRQAPDAAAALSALPAAVVVLDEQQRFVVVNPAAEQFFQGSAATLAQARLVDFIAPDSPLFDLIATARATASPVSDHDLTLESPRLSRSGIAVHAAVLPDDPTHVVLALIDASTAQKLDRQLSLRHAARSVEGMAAILAHEVKNPLSGIRGAAQLLEAGLSDADRELTQLICDEVDRIRALVERMEQFGGRPVAFGPVNINQVLDHVKRVASRGFASHVRFVEVYDPSLPEVWGNRDQLVQVCLNLVKNAAEAVPERGGEITLMTAWQHGVRLAFTGGGARVHLPIALAVRDNGSGIADDLRDHLFDPFVTTKAGGQGLGLALVAKIIGDHGGLAEAESVPGRTTFRLMLPMAPTPGSADASVRPDTIVPEGTGQA